MQFFVPLNSVQGLIYNLLSLLILVIFADILISNLICFGAKISHRSRFVTVVRGIADPIVNPLRRLLPNPARTGNLDFAPMIALVIIQAVRNSLY